MYLEATEIRFTDHARERMWQRGIREEQVMAVLRRGVRSEGADRCVIFSMPEPKRGTWISREDYALLGIRVVCTPELEVIKTVCRDEIERDPYEVYEHLASSPPRFTLGDVLSFSFAKETP